MLLSDILQLNVDSDPERIALVAGDTTMTYGALQTRCHRLANALGALAQRGDRIGILAENVPEYVEAYYGAPRAGMPLTLLNYRLHPNEWAWILNNAEARVLLVDSTFLAAVDGLLVAVPSLEHVVVIGACETAHPHLIYEELLDAADACAPTVTVDDDDVAWLIYTSGTTGFPKGAMLTHRNLMSSILNGTIAFPPGEQERALVAMPLCHVAGYFVPFQHLRGGTVVLMKAYDPEAFMDLVQRHQVTITGLAPAMINFILNHPRATGYDLSSIRTLSYGAAPMPLEVLRLTMERFGPSAQTVFGMTELAGSVTFLNEADHLRAVQGDTHLLASCGRPGLLSAVEIMDDGMSVCAPGVVGEIVVRGEQVMSGYWRNEHGTKEAMAGGWFHTGDMAYRDNEGYLYIVDRKKDMIVSGGENVYCKEVEDVLFEHADVLEAAVIGLPDPTWGERVTAVVVLQPGASATESDIIASCKSRLAGYKAPKTVILAEELPKNTTGKVLKRQLRDIYAPAGPP